MGPTLVSVGVVFVIEISGGVVFVFVVKTGFNYISVGVVFVFVVKTGFNYKHKHHSYRYLVGYMYTEMVPTLVQRNTG